MRILVDSEVKKRSRVATKYDDSHLRDFRTGSSDFRGSTRTRERRHQTYSGSWTLDEEMRQLLGEPTGKRSKPSVLPLTFLRWGQGTQTIYLLLCPYLRRVEEFPVPRNEQGVQLPGSSGWREYVALCLYKSGTVHSARFDRRDLCTVSPRLPNSSVLVRQWAISLF